MRYILLITILWACSGRPDPNLILSNPEAFAFDLGNSWEINASVKATGFTQLEKEDEYSISLSYSVDLILPNQDSLCSIYNESVEEQDIEEFMDIILEAQFEVDSTFGEGSYKLIFYVTDEFSKQSRSIAIDFNLSK